MVQRPKNKIERWWRTRQDPFAEVWPRIQRELESNPTRKATSFFIELQSSYPEKFTNGQLRTLQRRIADWRNNTSSYDKIENWTLTLLQGKINEAEFYSIIGSKLQKQNIEFLLFCIRYKGIRSRNRAVAILAHLKGVPIPIIGKILRIENKTVHSYILKFNEFGLSKLFDFSRNISKKADKKEYKDALFSTLHEPPALYGINRTRWEMRDLKRVMDQKGLPISLFNIRKIIRNAGYKFRKARKVLTSNDPEYREKLKRITDILSKLKPDERFFSVDEFGPFSIKIIGGRAFDPPGQYRAIPQYQKSKGKLILTAALELSTNQITHFYSQAKNTNEMIRLLDILFEKYNGIRTMYFSWDAASWHASKKLYKHVNYLNRNIESGKSKTPRVELAPLPACAQFLNVIESVFSGMSRAILHNSNYESIEDCMLAIDSYFMERNENFIKNPRKAGKKIWGNELVTPVFQPGNNCKDPRWQR